MANTSFIEKCFQKWLEENPDGTYPQFILLCKMWIHAREDIYGKVRRYTEMGDKQKLNSLYGKFTKTPKQMFDEGWCKDCLGDISKCLKKGACVNDEKNI